MCGTKLEFGRAEMSLIWFSSRAQAESCMNALADIDKAVIDRLLERRSIVGFCAGCSSHVTFRLPAPRPDLWTNTTEELACTCGLNGRMRNALTAWRATRRSGDRSMIMERVTPLFVMMSRENPQLVGCEYLGDGKAPGQDYPFGDLSVRHENLLALSCPDASLDLLMHFDVLEHVPDHRAALKECHRALAPGGTLLFTIPFYTYFGRNLVRARTKDGVVEHILPPSYHGNPVSANGALVFIHPSWEILDNLAEAGFTGIELGLNYDITGGIVSNGCPFPDGHCWPAIFRARRPA